MVRYVPALEVRHPLTDEALHNGEVYGPNAAATLLRLPAEYRHACVVEAALRCRTRHETEETATSSDGVQQIRERVADEILAQLDREQTTPAGA